MTSFVLVHGAWSGGWKWRFVAPILRRAGHEVHTPTLTGLGERAHLARPDIDLDVHVQDVVGLLEMEDLRDVVLVGHSYGGMVVSGVAERAAGRIRRLVHLDAFVPENGKCAIDYIVPERAAGFRAQGERDGFVDPPPVSLWGLAKPEHVAFARQRETRHPYRTLTQALRRVNSSAGGAAQDVHLPLVAGDPAGFDQFAQNTSRSRRGATTPRLGTGHDAMVLVPGELAEILLQSAQE